MKKRVLIVFLIISLFLIVSVIYGITRPQRLSPQEIAAEVHVETSKITLTVDLISSAKKYNGYHTSYDESSGILSITIDSSLFSGEFLPKIITIPNTYPALTSIKLIGNDTSDSKVIWEIE